MFEKQAQLLPCTYLFVLCFIFLKAMLLSDLSMLHYAYSPHSRAWLVWCSLLSALDYSTAMVPSSFSCSDAISWTNNNWSIPIISSILYLVLIYFGKQWMKNREPFDLKGPLFMWNSAIAIFSIMGASVCVPALISSVREKGFVYTSCTSDSSMVCFWVFLFMLSKIVEFGDTIFVVLRKKPLMFLHWYHHVSVLNVTWLTVARSASGICHWASSVNYTIHSVMYSYYAATSVGIRFPAAIPLIITVLQIVQMFVVSTVSITAFIYRSSCPVDTTAVWSTVIVSLSYAVLFGNYFIQRYILKKKKKKDE